MRILKKVISAAICAATVLSISVNAYAIAEPLAYNHYRYMGSPEYTNTSRGKNGFVEIRSRVFTNLTQPSTNIQVYSCGVISDISTSSTLETYFSIAGTLHTPSSTVNISAYGSANSKMAQTVDENRKFNYCHSTTTTTSSVAFGSSSMECNRSIKY